MYLYALSYVFLEWISGSASQYVIPNYWPQYQVYQRRPVIFISSSSSDSKVWSQPDVPLASASSIVSTSSVASTSPVATSAGQKVQLDVYYETNCPDSMRFITRQLYPLYQDMKDVLSINLVPFGKASETYDPISNAYVFRCHHGPPECHGNTVQSCAISLYPNIEDHLNFVNCMESYPRPSESGQKCARRLSLDWGIISKCADGNEGNRLLHENAQKTNVLNPRLNFVPWINVNKSHSDSIQRRSMRELKGVVCEYLNNQHAKC